MIMSARTEMRAVRNSHVCAEVHPPKIVDEYLIRYCGAVAYTEHPWKINNGRGVDMYMCPYVSAEKAK